MDNQLLGPDLLSELQVSLIESILMLLPIRDAIRTSVLSSKWRYRWTRLPQLVFHGDHMGEVGDLYHEMRLKNFVTRTLFLHQGPIHKFDLFVECMDSCPVTDQWLLFLSRREIKELILKIEVCGDEYFHLPSCLYSCQNLTLLDLSGCHFRQPPPTFKGFFYLRSLILQYSKVSSDAIESIVASSPLLENFQCVYSGDSELRISAPNLNYFCMECASQELYLCAPLLAEMSITLDEKDFPAEQQKHSICNYTKFLGDFTKLESLTGNGHFTKFLSIGIQYYLYPLVLDHLQFISLCPVNFQDIDEILAVVRLTMDAPNLLMLQIMNAFIGEDASKAPHINFWDSEWLHNCTFKRLEFIRLAEFCGGVHEMKFIKFLLESSPVLEKMIVEASPFLKKVEDTLSPIVELMSYRRASPNAKILLEK